MQQKQRMITGVTTVPDKMNPHTYHSCVSQIPWADIINPCIFKHKQRDKTQNKFYTPSYAEQILKLVFGTTCK